MREPVISGFTIVRNAIRYDYPVIESIRSILPLVDEMVVLVGNSDDETLNLIRSIGSDKLRIHESVWDDSLREGGRVLAVETNKAFRLIRPDADWAFYIQADEVVHEEDHAAIRQASSLYLDQPEVEGLLFNYNHFYGSYAYIGNSRKWYRNEIRMVRNLPGIESFRDAQGFRLNHRLMKVKPVPASIFHYGWVKDPQHQQAKQESFHKMWHDDNWVEKHVVKADAYDYAQIDSLELFKGSHPAVMEERLKRMNWNFEFDTSQTRFGFKDRLLFWFEKLTGKRLFEYKNYRVI